MNNYKTGSPDTYAWECLLHRLWFDGARFEPYIISHDAASRTPMGRPALMRAISPAPAPASPSRG